MAESTAVRCLVSPNLSNTKTKIPKSHLLPISSLPRKHEASSAAITNGGGSSRRVKRLITLSPSEGKWNGNWNTQYDVSLRDLDLEDLVEDGPTNARVSVDLSVQRHASMGLSVDGRIMTSIARKCNICSSLYPQLGFSFKTLLSIRARNTFDDIHVTISIQVSLSGFYRQVGKIELQDCQKLAAMISKIYVRPGYEANLDSLVQDTIRLTTYAEDICSESSEKSEPTFYYVGEKNTASVHKRWSGLLKLKKK